SRFSQLSSYRLGAEECAAQMSCQHTVPGFFTEFEETFVGNNSGVVHEDVDGPERCCCGFDHFFNGLRTAYVCSCGPNLRSELAKFVCSVLDNFWIWIRSVALAS